MTSREVIQLQQRVDDVKMDPALLDYVIALAAATRENDDLQVGVSPRGALALSQAARATAVLQGRDYCVPEDIVSNVLPVSAHRVISKTYMHAGDTASARRIIQQVLETVPSPA
jgi:MoxR-like ATPase